MAYRIPDSLNKPGFSCSTVTTQAAHGPARSKAIRGFSRGIPGRASKMGGAFPTEAGDDNSAMPQERAMPNGTVPGSLNKPGVL